MSRGSSLINSFLANSRCRESVTELAWGVGVEVELKVVLLGGSLETLYFKISFSPQDYLGSCCSESLT